MSNSLAPEIMARIAALARHAVATGDVPGVVCQAPPSNVSAMGNSRWAEAFARWVFAHPKLLSITRKLAQCSGKAPRLPGIAAVQDFQKQSYAALGS